MWSSSTGPSGGGCALAPALLTTSRAQLHSAGASITATQSLLPDLGATPAISLCISALLVCKNATCGVTDLRYLNSLPPSARRLRVRQAQLSISKLPVFSHRMRNCIQKCLPVAACLLLARAILKHMQSSHSDGALERRRRKREARYRLHAIASFLIRSERRGLRVSPHAQYVLENECLEVFKDYGGPPDTFQFASTLRETAVRMFRQGRYKEANQRYRMASLFNPFDPTLLSNRATCIYNLKRYRRCVEICQLCLSAFPNLFYTENTGLYFQVLILLANALIKLRDFGEAEKVFKDLVSVKNRLSSEKDTRVSMTEALNKLRRFQIDLKIAKQSPSDLFEESTLREEKPARPADFPYQKERGRFLHPHTPSCYLLEINTGIDDYNLSAKEDGDPNLIVNVEHLCYHIYHMGMGPCGHDDNDLIWQNDSESCSTQGDNEDFQEGSCFGEDTNCYADYEYEEDEYEGKIQCTCGRNHNEESGVVSRDELASNDEEIFPDRNEVLRCDEFGFVESNSLDNEEQPMIHDSQLSDSSHYSELNLGVNANRNPNPESLDGAFSQNPTSSSLKYKTFLSMDDAVESLRLARYSDASPFDQSGKESESDQVFCRLASELACFVSGTQNDTEPSPIQDSDNEEPISKLDFSHVRENEDWDLFEKAFKVLPSGNDTFLSRCTAQVFGNSFHSSGALDFTRYFGPHLRLQSQGGKKKSKACDRNCPPCFARRMWKLRFKSHKVGEAKQFFASVYDDERRDDRNFLSLHEWSCSGNYGSGYELATEHGILVHGVAYLILLQNEVCWQRNDEGLVNGVQKPFSAALFKNMKTRTDLAAISSLRDMLLETLYLMHCIKYQAWKGVAPSHQFVRTAALVAEMVSPSPDLSSLSIKDGETRLMIQNESAVENMNKWAAVGHLSKEEEWVYHTLSRDVREVILHFERKALDITLTSLPPILNINEGEVNGISHIKELLYGQRCRQLENMSASRKVVDLERGEALLSRAIRAFPLKLSLYFKRADIRYRMKKWDACIWDLNKIQALLEQQKEANGQHALVSEQQKVMLYHVFLLEGDAHRAKAQELNSGRKRHIIASIDHYKRAVSLCPKKKRTRVKILQKVRQQEHLLALMDKNKGAKRKDDSSAKKSRRERKPSAVKQMVMTPQINSCASSEEGEEAFAVGNRYGALLKESSETPPSLELRQDRFQPAASRPDLRSVDNKFNRNRRIRIGSNNRPSPETILSEVRRILSLFGGAARSTDIVDNLDLTEWNVQDSGDFISKTYKTLHSLCSEYGTGFETRASSHSDPIIALTNDGDFTPVSRTKICSSSTRRHNEKPSRGHRASHANHSRSRSSRLVQSQSQAMSQTRASESIDFEKMIANLLRQEKDTQKPGQSVSESKTDRDIECCICMDNPSDSLTIPCRHPFCEACILNYLTRENADKNCPVCRSEVTNVECMVVHKGVGK